MATPLARAFVRLELDRINLNNSIEGAVRSGGQAGQQEADKQAAAIKSRFVRGLQFGAGLFAASGLINSIKSIGTFAISSASNLEQLRIGFTTILGSSGSANQFLQQLQTFANRTPFNFQDVAQYSQQLLAMGFSAKSVIPDLQAVGDAVAAMGRPSEDVGRIVYALGQMQQEAHVNAGDLRQLTDTGLPALKILADGLHTSTAGVQDMITKGQLLGSQAIPILISGLENGTASVKGFGGAMEAQSHTFAGLMSTLHDSAQSALANGLQPLLKDMEGGLPTAINVTGTALTGLTSVLGGGISVMQHYSREILDVGIAFGAWKIITGIPGALSAVSSGIETVGLKALYARDAVAEFGAGSTVLGATLAGVSAGGLLLIANGLVSFISGAHEANSVIHQLNSEIAKTPSSLKTYDDAIKQVGDRIDSLNASVGGGDFIHGFLGAFTGASEKYIAEIGKLRDEQEGLYEGQRKVSASTELLADQMGGSNVGAVLKYRDIIQNLANRGLIDFSKSQEANAAAVQHYVNTVINGTPAQQSEANVLKTQGDNASTAADKVNALVSAYQSLAGTNQSLLGDQIAVAGAIADLGQNIDKSSRSLDVNTEAGRTNLTAINQAAQAIEKYAQDQLAAGDGSQGAIAKVNAQIFLQSQQLEQQMIQLGFTKDAADQYIQKLLATPDSVRTNVSLPGVASATQHAIDLYKQLHKIPGNVRVEVSAVDNATKILGDVTQAIQGVITGVTSFDDNFGSGRGNATRWNFQSSLGHAAGWRVPGYGGGDRWPALLEGGESVVPKELTPAVAPFLAAHGVPGFSRGGLIGIDGASIGDYAARLMIDTTGVSQSILDQVSPIADMARAIKAGLAGVGAGVGGAGVSRLTGTVLTVLGMLGLSAGLLPKVLAQIATESSGQSDIVNRTDSNWAAGHPSVGDLQVIGPTFAAYAGPFRNTGPFLYGTSINDLANIFAGVNYELHKSGPSLPDFGQGHGYDNGGGLQPGWTAAYNGTGRVENVQTAEQQDAVVSLLAEQNQLLRQQNALLAGVPGALAGSLNGVSRSSRLDQRTRPGR